MTQLEIFICTVEIFMMTDRDFIMNGNNNLLQRYLYYEHNKILNCH